MNGLGHKCRTKRQKLQDLRENAKRQIQEVETDFIGDVGGLLALLVNKLPQVRDLVLEICHRAHENSIP